MDMNEKKSFMLYFNHFDVVCRLPVDQRGLLLTALYDFARQEALDPRPLEEVLARYPDMSGECVVTATFMAQLIRIDTEKWRKRQRSRLGNRRDQQEQKREEAWDYV